MPRRTVKRSNKRPRVRQVSRELSISANSYRGPALPRWAFSANHSTELILTDNVDLASTAGGAIADVYGNSPTGAPNWADTNTVWGEYRTLAITVEFYPNNRYSKTTTTCVPIAVVVDRRASTALASYDSATSHESCRLLSLEDPWRQTIKMTGSEESQFVAVSAPNSSSWVKLYASGLTVSTTYGKVFIKYLVQFRNVE
jgi:hypothetical protein